MKKIIYLVSTIVTLAACNSLPSDNSGSVQLTNDKDLVNYGAGIYAKHCVNCHGANGESTITGTPSLKATTLNEEAIGNKVFHGAGMMPKFEDVLGEPEIRAVSLYVLEFKKDAADKIDGK